MKVYSVWQPWASLSIHGFKIFETKGYPAPRSIIGQRVGIASTKNITADQRSAAADADFERWYEQTGLAPLDELPRGMLLGTVLIHASVPITDEFLDDITDEERAFGWYGPGRHAWRLRDPIPLAHPIPVSGKQGIWEYKGFDNGTPIKTSSDDGAETKEAAQGKEEGHLRPVLRLHLHTS